MAHTAVSTKVVYSLQSKLPTPQSASITVHCTQNEKTVIIQLCQYRYPSSNDGWCIMNWNGCDHGLSEEPLQHLLERRGNSQWKSVTLACAITIWTNPFSRFVYYPSPLTEQMPYSYPSLPQYVHTLALTTIYCRYIYCMPASHHTHSSIYSTALHQTKYTSVDVNAQSKVRWWVSYCSEDPM